MKVLVSAYACDPSKGGEFTNGWNYAHNAVNGISVWCLTTHEGKEAISDELERNPIPTLHVVYIQIPDWIQKVKDQMNPYGVYLHYWYFQREAHKVACQLRQEVRFDLVHHATYGSLQMGTFLWRMKIPMLFGPVGGGQRSPKAFKRYFGKWWRLELMRDVVSYLLITVIKSPLRVLKNSAITLVVNDETYSMAQRFGAKHIRYAPCSLLPDTFGPPTLPMRKYEKSIRLLWVGRLIARKGLLLVLEALASIDKSLPVSLTVIGDGDQQNDLPGWLTDLNLNDRVTWLGRLPISDVKNEYASHDVFIYCSLRETLGSQILESMAYGLPSILLNHQGIKTFVPDDAAWKIEVTSPRETVEKIRYAIENLLNDPIKRKAIGERAFKVAKEFIWSTRIKQINEYYKSIINKDL